MRLGAPAFWYRERPGLVARLLAPLGAIYGAATARRMESPGRRAAIPVICVGNFVAGGAGKTPTVLALAEIAAAQGIAAFALTRGYGGRLAGPLRVDPARHDAAAVGDEALLLAHRLPTVLARDRAEGAAFAAAQGAGLVILDDGLQNPGLAKDFTLAVVDAAVGVGNGLCLPAGPLRAPLTRQLRHVDAVLAIGEGAAGEAVAAVARAADKPVLAARIETDPDSRARLAGRRVIAASGIGRPEKFRATLLAAGANLIGERVFGDHHAYDAADVRDLLLAARREDALIATTEKDETKLAPLWPEAERDRLTTVAIRLVFADPAPLAAEMARLASRS